MILPANRQYGTRYSRITKNNAIDLIERPSLALPACLNILSQESVVTFSSHAFSFRRRYRRSCRLRITKHEPDLPGSPGGNENTSHTSVSVLPIAVRHLRWTLSFPGRIRTRH